MQQVQRTARLPTLGDPLAYLPHASISEYRKGETIYDQTRPASSIYLVIEGKVKVCRVSDNGVSTLVDIYQPDDLFGESAFVSSSRGAELSTAFENTRVMGWTATEIEEISERRPELAIALLQLFVYRSQLFQQRIEDFTVDNIARRLARALLCFAERMGQVTQDGRVEMRAFTHELLAQYVGTSREIVTHYMNQFRRKGYLSYSRKSISLHRESIQEWLLPELLAA